jgi:2-oxoglutarate ferredoxin oxidoreductase subunit beta
MSTIQDFSGYQPTWCPGCGNFGIGIAIKSALTQLGMSPSDIFVSFGIGCSGNMNDFLNAYASHGMHGRALPVAIGMKLANHTMKTIVVAGDGDFYGEGGNHFLHGCRGNHDITVVAHDNRVYGLTTGQAAPTADKGYKSKSTPKGIIEVPVNPLGIAIMQGASFVAQSFAGDTPHLIETLKKAIAHKGFSLVNVLQPCVTFNKVNTYKYYMEHTYKLGAEYTGIDQGEALQKAMELNEQKFPLGVLYNVEKPVFHEQISQLHEGPLASNTEKKDLVGLLDQFI